LREAIGAQELRKLVSSSTEKTQLGAMLAETEFSIELVGLYKLVLERAEKPKLTELVLRGLRNLPKESWAEALVTDKHGLVDLVEWLQKSDVGIGLGIHLQDALIELAGTTIQTSKVPENVTREKVNTLVGSLTSYSRETLNAALCDKIVEAKSTIGPMVELFGDSARDCKSLERQCDRLVRVGLKAMLDRGNAAELDWMEWVIQNCEQVMVKCPEPSRQVFDERIRSSWQKAEDEEVKGRLERIVRLRQIEIRGVEETEGSNERDDIGEEKKT
jgi:hypothetical protein